MTGLRLIPAARPAHPPTPRPASRPVRPRRSATPSAALPAPCRRLPGLESGQPIAAELRL
jgi:hypothetical protein